MTDFYFNIVFSSLFASFIRFCLFYLVARSLFSIVRSSARSGYLTIIDLWSDIDEYVFPKIYYVIKSLKLDNVITRSIKNTFSDNLLVETPSS